MVATVNGNGRPVQRHRRRAENFRVRRWLQVGAASAGLGAALLGLSPVGPQVGTARADDSGQSSASSGSDPGGSTGGAAASHSPAGPKDDAKGVGAEQSSISAKDVAATNDPVGSGGSVGPKDTVAATKVDAKITADQVVVRAAEVAVDTDGGTAKPVANEVVVEARVLPPTTSTADDSSVTTKPRTVVETAATTGGTVGPRTSTVAAAPEAAAAVTTSAVPQANPVAATSAAVTAAPAQPWGVVQVVSPPPRWTQLVDGFVSILTSTTQSAINSLPLPDAFKELFVGVLWTVRRTYFNEAPAVAAVPISSQSALPITGRVEAVDPEGDPIVYGLALGPSSGSVQINSDGTYTYTPGPAYNGFDTFTFTAQDAGSHVNLLDPFRPVGTQVSVQVNQGGITFAFNYTTGSQYWSTDAQNALQAAANSLARYFTVASPVILTYDVTAEDSTSTNVLASAGSGLTDSGPGFFRTVVQNKLISGVDSNGAQADGQIDWNFGYSWGLGASVAAGQYDFTSTAMHELLHSFGFLSSVDQAGSNSGQGWTEFDSFIVTANGAKAIGPNFRWNSADDPNLTGGNGGLYFGGPGAVAGYGALVPLYTPNPWQSGSSMSHLDDATFTGAMRQLMNATETPGPGVRVLSPVELGILQDLGYTVVPQTSTSVLAAIGFIFVRRLRTRSRDDSARMSR